MSVNTNKFDLTGKTALITGAAGLLGGQHAIALLESGASVILTDIDLGKLKVLKESLDEAFDSAMVTTYLMDVAAVESIKEVSENLSKVNIRVDILINNAAIDPKVTEGNSLVETSRMENFPLEQWNMQISVGLTGAFLCSQVFGSKMADDKKGGVILNIASDLSVFSPDQRLYKKKDLQDSQQPVKPVTYSVIKTGLIGLTKYLSTYWSESSIRVNALSPGGVYVNQSQDFVNRLKGLIPLQRMAEPDEYRSAVQFLCSDASSYMTGQNLVMDGGRSVW